MSDSSEHNSQDEQSSGFYECQNSFDHGTESLPNNEKDENTTNDVEMRSFSDNEGIEWVDPWGHYHFSGKSFFSLNKPKCSRKHFW